MSLIEQLGGYKKAKSIRDINIIEFDGDASGVIIHYMGNSITQEDLERALLEYRRKHNIFEIGDLYVFTEKYSKHSVIHKVDSLNSGKGCIRHATDEEIKAGRRL